MKNYFGKIINFISHLNNSVNKLSFNKVKLISNKIYFNKNLVYSKERKNYYLPLPINNNTELVNFKYKILSNVSGLATIDPLLRLKLQNDPKYHKTFSIFMLMETTKIIYCLFNNNYFKEDFLIKILKSLSVINIKNIPNVDKEFEVLIKKKHLSTCQHLLNIICHKFFVDIETLNHVFPFSKNIDFSAYKKISIGNLIEFLILNTNLNSMNIASLFNIISVNHQDLNLHESCDIYKVNESQAQIEQSFSDFLFYQLFVDAYGNIKILKIYKDVKTDFYGPTTGHLTLKPYLSVQEKSFDLHMNAYTSWFLTLLKKENIIKDTILYDLISKDLERLLIIKKKCFTEKGNFKNIMLEFNTYIFKMGSNPLYVALGFNPTIVSEVPLDNIFTDTDLIIILKNIENNYELFNINIFFPKNNEINLNEFNNTMIEIINKIFPEHLRKNIENNFTKFIENNNE